MVLKDVLGAYGDSQAADALEKGKFRVRIGGDARMLDRLARLVPQRATILVANKMRALID